MLQSSPMAVKPPKTVRVVVPKDDDWDSDAENRDVTNITVTATISSPSKSNKRHSIAHLKLDEEVKKAAEAKRRTSEGHNIVNMADEDKESLTHLVASLRRQNDELRNRLDGGAGAGSGGAEEAEMRKLAEKECEELRLTVAKLDKLLQLEREERNVCEQKTLEMLQNVKKKWHEKDENRVQRMRSDLQAANTVVQEMEVEMMKKQGELETAKRELEAVTDVKACLKAKLEKCKIRLENTIEKYEDKCRAVEKLEAKYTELERHSQTRSNEDGLRKRRDTMTLNENRIELEAIRLEVDKMKERRCGLETELDEAKSAVASANKKLEVIRKEKVDVRREYEEHLAKCEANTNSMVEENSRLRAEMEEQQSSLREKTSKLKELEEVLEGIERKIPSEGYSKAKEELEATVEQLQQELRLKKVEVRVAERAKEDMKERVAFLREMLKEEREKRETIEVSSNSEQDKISGLEAELRSEKSARSNFEEKNEDLQSRLAKMTKEINELRNEVEQGEGLHEKCQDLESQLLNKTKELDGLKSVKKHYDLTKNVCYELEDQIKEYESIIKKLETSQTKHLETIAELKSKSESSSTDLISTRGELNELKSMIHFRDSQIKDLEEKNKESKVFYEMEGEKWKARYEEVALSHREQTATLMEVKDELVNVTGERDRAVEVNEHLKDQNSRLKEESASLITGIHSLKDSNMMLQGSVRELADKLQRRDKEIERQGEKIEKLVGEMQIKEHEHKVTLEQLKKLTLHLPEGIAPGATPSKSKSTKHFPSLL